MLVEDEKLLSSSIKAVLDNDGYSRETAFTFGEAEDRLVSWLYDLVVLDLNLPGGLGFDLFEYIKVLPMRPGVLIISVRDSLTDELHSLDLGADDYLVKPFHLDELLARVCIILRHLDQPHELRLGILTYQLDAQLAPVAGVPLRLTQSQLRLLYYAPALLLAAQQEAHGVEGVAFRMRVAEKRWPGRFARLPLHPRQEPAPEAQNCRLRGEYRHRVRPELRLAVAG